MIKPGKPLDRFTGLADQSQRGMGLPFLPAAKKGGGRVVALAEILRVEFHAAISKSSRIRSQSVEANGRIRSGCHWTAVMGESACITPSAQPSVVAANALSSGARPSSGTAQA